MISLKEAGGEVVAVEMLDGTTVRVKVDLWEADAAYQRLFREHFDDLPERADGEPATPAERDATAALMRAWRDWLAGRGFPVDLTVATAADVYAELRKKKEPPSDGPSSPASTASTPAASRKRKSGRSKS